MNQRHNRGFTLLELLVVIAIIGILTTVIVASINTSRSKTKDAAIISDLKQFQILLNLEYNESGSYAKLQTTGGNFITAASSCDNAFSPPPAGSNYYDKAREICKSIIANSPRGNGSTWGFLADVVTIMGTPQDDKYSTMAVLNIGPYDTTYYCLGMSGSSLDNGSLRGIGCWANP